MNYFITGDKHGSFYTILQTDVVKDSSNAIIILGDAGFNFRLNKMDDRLKKEILQHSSCIWYCVRGNHCARPQDVDGYKLIHDDDVNGEVYVQDEYSNLRFFKDWGEYLLGNYHVAVIGGAYSVDKWWRLARSETTDPRKTGWFPNEQLSADEMAQAQCDLSGKSFDFVFTHTCPKDWQPVDLFLSSIDQSTVDNTMELWLNDLKEKFHWYIWLFAHYHHDRIERPYVEQYFNDIEDLNTVFNRWVDYSNGQELPWWITKSPNFYKV